MNKYKKTLLIESFFVVPAFQLKILFEDFAERGLRPQAQDYYNLLLSIGQYLKIKEILRWLQNVRN